MAALNDDGEIYMWGPNDEGPSGGLDGDPAAESTGTFFPVKLEGLDDVEIVDIQTGPNHLIAVAADGTVYTFGSNADGRLGYSTEGSTYAPAAVEIGGDAAPYLVSAEPADNARDVAPGAAVVLTFTENVVAGEGEIRSNLAVGGSAEKTELTAREREICDVLGPELKRRGLLFVGIDVIGGEWLTEINVTSPTGIREIKRFGGPDIAVLIWDAIEKRRA